MLVLHVMTRALPVLFLLAFPIVAAAQDTPPSAAAPAAEAKPISIALEALGDSDTGVVTRISFRFAKPPEASDETPFFLQGSFMQDGQVLRNFRYSVPPDMSREVTAIQT